MKSDLTRKGCPAEELKKRAKEISKLIMETNTDHRGNLFYMIGGELTGNAQGYTGNRITMLGIEYGIDPSLPTTLGN